jgi:hypothetical protein
MAVVNLKHIKPFIWIPPEKGCEYKITVETSDGTVYDITDEILYNEVEDNVTESIGQFNFKLSNYDEKWTGIFTGNEIYRYYKDYADTATTLMFRGRIEKPAYSNTMLKCSGRSESKTFLGINVTESYITTETSVILKDLIATYGIGFTSTNVETSTVSVTVNWSEKNFWDCVKELCTAAGFECYVDPSLDFNYFLTGSRQNSTDAQVHDNNLFEVSEFATDDADIKNRIKVYGAEIDGIQIMYTAEDAASQTAKGIKEDVVNDDNITTYDQAKDFGDFLLAKGLNPDKTGESTSVLLATVKPGEKVPISSPLDGIVLGYYETSGWKDVIDMEGGLTTTLKIYKEPRIVSHVMKTIIENASKTQNTSANPESMAYAYTFTFDDDTGTHSNTQIVSGVLKLTAGQVSGSWISPVRVLTSNLDKCYMILNSTLITGVTVSVSGNGGIDYEILSNKTLKTISVAKGQNLYVKVEIADTTATCEINSLSVQYSLE